MYLGSAALLTHNNLAMLIIMRHDVLYHLLHTQVRLYNEELQLCVGYMLVRLDGCVFEQCKGL